MENDNQSTNKDDFKNETVDTFNEVKETIKDVDFKKDTAEAKGILVNFFKKPIETFKNIADGNGNFLKTAIILIVIWTIAVLLSEILYATNIKSFFKVKNLLDSFLAIISPTLKVIVMSLIIYVLTKEKLVKIVTLVTFARIPTIISAILILLNKVSFRVTYLTNPISNFVYFIYCVLIYFVFKVLYKNADEEVFKKFLIGTGIYYIVAFVLRFLEIYI